MNRSAVLLAGLGAKYPGLRTRGFWRYLRTVMEHQCETDGWNPAFRVYPDAWRVLRGPQHGYRHDVHVLEAVEIVDSNDVSDIKMARYQVLARAFDCTDSLALHLRIVHRFGGETVYVNDELCYAASRFQRQEVALMAA